VQSPLVRTPSLQKCVTYVLGIICKPCGQKGRTQSAKTPLRNPLVWSCLCQVSKVSEKDLQDQQCEYSPQALSEPTSIIYCLHDHFLDDQFISIPHLYFLYLNAGRGAGQVPRSHDIDADASGETQYAVVFDGEPAGCVLQGWAVAFERLPLLYLRPQKVRRSCW
jgi:hypothetical protein